MIEAKKNKHAYALKEVKCLYHRVWFYGWHAKGLIGEGRKNQ
jgi:hypothetical protein